MSLPSPEARASNLFSVFAGMILIVGLVLSWWAANAARRQYLVEANLRFARFADRLSADIDRRANLPVYGLKGARGVYAASERVTREEFAAYVASRELAVEFPGVLGIGFIERVARENLDAFVAAARADGADDFSVRASGEASDLYVVKYIYPREPNKAAEGYDVGSESIRRAAVEQAARTGRPTFTARIALVQDARRRAGFHYLLPIFRNGQPASTPEERKAALLGLVYAPIVVDDLLADVVAGSDHLLDVEIFDGTKPSADTLILDSDDTLDANPSASQAGPTRGGHLFHRVDTIPIGGRIWTLVLTSTPAFEASVERRVPMLIGVAGTLATLLLVGTLFA